MPEIIKNAEGVESTYYTESEWKELNTKLEKSVQGARAGQYNKGRDETKQAILEKIIGNPAFADYKDLDLAIEEILPLAEARKRNAKHDTENERRVKELTDKNSATERKYEKFRIRAAIADKAKGVADLKDFTTLLESEFRLKLVEENGEDQIVILDSQDRPMMKDGYTPFTLEDVIEDLKGKKPYLVASEAKVALDVKQRTGSPQIGSSLAQIMKKPYKEMNATERAQVAKATREGKIKSVSGNLVLVE